MMKMKSKDSITYKSDNNTLQIGVDLTFIEPRLMDVSSAITSRYDAGICKHRLERTGVMVIEYEDTERDTSSGSDSTRSGLYVFEEIK